MSPDITSPENITLQKKTAYPEQVKKYMKNEGKSYPEEIARKLTARDLWLKHETKRADKYIGLSRIDPLTGLFNRRHLDGNDKMVGELQREFSEAERAGLDLTLMMIDIDDFKKFNDLYGHSTGDRVLKLIAELLRKTIRAGDRPFRYGGEEIVLLLSETDIESAKKIAQRIIEGVKNIEGLSQRVTVSMGIASYLNSPANKNNNFPTRIITKDDLLQKADAALYYAKELGKDQYTVANYLREQDLDKVFNKIKAQEK